MDEIKPFKYDDPVKRVYEYMYQHYSQIYAEDEIIHALKAASYEKADEISNELN